jgi:hypothetical protein
LKKLPAALYRPVAASRRERVDLNANSRVHNFPLAHV